MKVIYALLALMLLISLFWVYKKQAGVGGVKVSEFGNYSEWGQVYFLDISGNLSLTF
jgi:hypothetical protein